MILDNINLVKVKTIRPKHKKINSKLNTSHFGSSQLSMIQYTRPKDAKKGVIIVHFHLNTLDFYFLKNYILLLKCRNLKDNYINAKDVKVHA